MREHNRAKKRLDGIINFLNTMNDFCRASLICTLILSAAEFMIIIGNMIYDISQSTYPIAEIYIPMVQQVLIFAVIMMLFTFIFDFVARKSKA